MKKNHNHTSRKIVLFFILSLIFARSFFVIYQNRVDLFSRDYNYNALKRLYYSSQYVVKNAKVIIPDESLESFAAGAFLRGVNPILIISDQPPLGRYINSLFIIFFDNARIITIFVTYLSAFGIFLLSRKVIKNFYLSLIPLAIFLNEPLTLQRLAFSPLLEPIQLPFIIFTIYSLVKYNESKQDLKWLILSQLLLGCVISIRYFILGLFLLAASLVFIFVKNKLSKKTLKFLLTTPIAILVLVLSYTVTIIDGSSIFHVFGIQKYMYIYHKTGLILPLTFWDLLIFNRWHTWWGNYSITSDAAWIIAWPVSVIVTILGSIAILFKKIKITDAELLMLLWTVFYSIMLSGGYVSVRYFLPLVPFLYILSVSFSEKLVKLRKR